MTKFNQLGVLILITWLHLKFQDRVDSGGASGGAPMLVMKYYYACR